MPTPSIRLFYDVVSPYSFLAFEVLMRYKRDVWKDVDFILEPFFLGAVMAASGNSPPGTVPAKNKYMRKDLARNSAWLQVPLNMPGSFPVPTLKAQRLLTIIKTDSPENLEEATRRLFKLVFQESKAIDDDIALGEALSFIGTEKVSKWLSDGVNENEVKEELKRITSEAIAKGAFGAPTILVTDDRGTEEMFFGSDRMEHIGIFLKRKWMGPCPKL